MKYFYSAAVMGYGIGRPWHRRYDFPNFPRVTKTLTLRPTKGNPRMVLPMHKSVWNRVALDNMGFYPWYELFGKLFDEMYNNPKHVIVSLAGTTQELTVMLLELNHHGNFGGIELNYSCPNVKTDNYSYGGVPTVVDYIHDIPVYLKLRYDENPYDYDLSNITGIRLNSVPFMAGGASGKLAQKKNWSFIKKYGKELNVAGCSFTCEDDIKRLEDMGCTEIGIGSTILTNPRLIERLKDA